MKDIGVDKEAIRSYLLTFFFPICGLFYSFNNWTEKHSKNVFWMFCAYTGLILIYQPYGTVLGEGSDGGRYISTLVDMHGSVKSFKAVSEHFYDGNTIDIFSSILTYVVSRFTDNGHIFFLVLAIIYGYFYSRNIWYILDKLPEQFNRTIWILIAFLFLACPIWNINGVRMWTAAQVFVYGALPHLIALDRKKLLWCPAAILIHHSFIIPNIILLLYSIFIKYLNRNNVTLTVVFSFYVISLFLNQLDLSILNNVLQGILPTYYNDRIDDYVNYDTANNLASSLSGNSLHYFVFIELLHWTVALLIFFSYFAIKNNRQSSQLFLRLYTFVLIFYGVANLISDVPGGGRFTVIANMFTASALILIMTYLPKGRYFRTLLPIIFFLLACSLIFEIRKGLDYYGYNLLLGNYITAPMLQSNVPIIKYIKDII
jgi:hypothetical protein